MKVLLLTALLWANSAKTSTLFLPDSDTAALVMLVSNTASTVANTLKILEVAKKTSDKIDKYNSMAMRRFFIARRIEQHTRDLIAAKKLRPKNLRQINAVLSRLKLNIRSLKRNLNLIARDLVEAEAFVDQYWAKMASAIQDQNEAHRQEMQSASEGKTPKHIQNTAINTALAGKVLAKMRRDNLEYQKIDLAIKKNRTLEKVQTLKWLGLGGH